MLHRKRCVPCGVIGGIVYHTAVIWSVAAIVFLIASPLFGQSTRQVISLNGPWKLSADGVTRDVTVPGTFESQIAGDFDGVATYEREIKPIAIPEHHRLLIRFAGAATETVTWFNDAEVGSHLGAWTPFVFDVSDEARKAPAGPWRLKVQVDEKVGHHTQGFLPIIQPHFGGLWNDVELRVVPEAWIDDDRVLAVGDWDSGNVLLNIPIGLQGPTVDCHLEVEMETHPHSRLASLGTEKSPDENWFSLAEDDFKLATENVPESDEARRLWNDGAYSNSVPSFFEKEQAWTPANPQVFSLRIRLRGPASLDEITIPVAFRSIETRGTEWRLNDSPLMIRGILNWGYAPPSTAPSLDEAWMRREIELAQSYGFNLMKFCLWVPPKRYLELCDELGMLAWVEYPTWHAQLTQENLGDLRREYEEFLWHDRNHPSVIIRSLTCETGSSAELGVIQSLYDLCKQRAPGGLVEDDSSWIEWNRVSDFYDDHPYGNNHTWPATLERLNKYVAEREIKPLILGEAIAADTWTSPFKYHAWSKGAESYHYPGFLADNARWLEQIKLDDDELSTSARHYAMLMRKYQIEAYRRLVPSGGYVVSVIRDFPLASMGLIDYDDQPKSTVDDWSFHGETMILLETENDRRSFFDDEPIRVKLAVSHFGHKPIVDGRLTLSWVIPKAVIDDVDVDEDSLLQRITIENFSIKSGELQVIDSYEFDSGDVTSPECTNLQAELQFGDVSITNEWPIWIFPKTENRPPLVMHPSMGDSTSLQTAFDCVDWADRRAGQVICAARLDAELLDHAAQGGGLLLLPNGEAGSFPLEEHWFLRGGPAIFPIAKERLATSTRFPIGEMLTELQHFDLAGPVVPQLDSMLEHITPIFMLWDNHDRKETRTHGLVFEIPVGKGRILVSSLDHKRTTNAAGQWILASAVNDLAADPSGVMDPRGEQNLARLRAELNRNEIELQSRDWQFQADPKFEGEKNGWQNADFNDAKWKTIKADRHWEGQGYESLDGWAWYRLRVPIDEPWKKADKVFLNFTGVDDHYRLFINGKFVGSGGDIQTKTTAFDERKSYDITSFVRGHDTLQIAIAVYDWYGAGGIFRPVTLSTQPLGDNRPWLK